MAPPTAPDPPAPAGSNDQAAPAGAETAPQSEDEHLASSEDSRLVYDLLVAPLRKQVLAYAVQLGALDSLHHEPATAAELCRRFSLGPRGAQVLLLCLSSLRVISLGGDGRFHLLPVALTYLRSDSPFFVGDHLRLAKEQYEMFHGAISRDEPLSPERLACWEQGRAVPDAVDSTRRMHALTSAAGELMARMGLLSGVSRLLDVAAGSGGVSIALARRDPRLRVTVLELPEVCPVASAYVRDSNLQDRIETHPANMFADPFPGGHDAVLMSNVFHDWDLGRCLALSRKAAEALPGGGRLFLHEMLTEGPYQARPTVALFSLMMLFATRGRQYSLAELSSVLREAGFEEVTQTPAAGYFSLIEARKPGGA